MHVYVGVYAYICSSLGCLALAANIAALVVLWHLLWFVLGNVSAEPASIIRNTLARALVGEQLNEDFFRELLIQGPLSWTDENLLLQLYRSIEQRPGPSTLSAFLVGANLFVDGKVGDAEHVRRGFLDGKPVIIKFAKKVCVLVSVLVCSLAHWCLFLQGLRSVKDEFKVWADCCKECARGFVSLSLLEIDGVPSTLFVCDAKLVHHFFVFRRSTVW
jgi:hypothetical protein